MAWVIIGVVLLLIIVPIIRVLPSARQKEQMAMRQAARAAGVQVQLMRIEDPNPKQDKYVSHIGRQLEPILDVSAWRVQRKRPAGWRELPNADWCAKRNLDRSWRYELWPTDVMSNELIDHLKTIESLPIDVEQVEEKSSNIMVYWHERTKGDEQQVIDFLKDCAALPLHKPGLFKAD